MEKILSIVIPTYNMEEYLPRCLDSVVGTQYINDIEIIVVNDGSKDRSSEIAHSYKLSFPQSIIVIDKVNGNYGSTINAALQISTGKYIKILDADDWFDSNAFDVYLDQLMHIDSDLIVNGCKFHRSNRSFDTVRYNLGTNDTYDLSIFLSSGNNIQGLPMHTITYKTSLLKSNHYYQTEGISYTDNEWAFYPLQFVASIKYIDVLLYQYFTYRDGQTMSADMLKKHVGHKIVILARMIDFWRNNNNIPSLNARFMQRSILNIIRDIYRTLLLTKDIDFQSIEKIDSIVASVDNLYSISNEIYEGVIWKFKYVNYWRVHNNVYPPFVVKWLNIERMFFKWILSLLPSTIVNLYRNKNVIS